MSSIVSENKDMPPPKIVACPSCHGTGAIRCLPNKTLNPSCISIPPRSEEKCLCCDGKGWIIAEHIGDPFCVIDKRS